MATAKDLIVRPIAASDANRIAKALHYSGKVVQNSQLHLGVFLGGRCGGVMQFGPSLDKRKIQGLVKGTLWNEFIELNRMAFADWLPRNSESRCIGYSMRWIRKTYPHIKWVISFADGTQCGDGTIYRASGFVLTGIKENDQIWEAPTGEVFNDTASRPGIGGRKQIEKAKQVISRMTVSKGTHILETGASSMKGFKAAGWKPKVGFQLRYIYFIDKDCRRLLTVPELPFSEIDRRGAGMYKGKTRERSAENGTPGIQSGGGGVNPTRSLQVTGGKEE